MPKLNPTESFFPCKWPLVCAPMNQISDLRLALAATEAGIFASLVITDNTEQSVWNLEQQLNEFKKSTGHCNLILALAPGLFNTPLIKLFLEYKVSHIELIAGIEPKHLPVLKVLRSKGIKIIEKYLTAKNKTVNDFTESKIDVTDYIDAIDLKGEQGASRVIRTGETLLERYQIVRLTHATLPLIVTGGISTSKEVKLFLDQGATAIGLGTVFALSEESCINTDKKQQLVRLSYSDVIQVSAESQNQNAIVFSQTQDTDGNNTQGLILGRDSSDQGLIFMGQGLDNVGSIKPLRQIVQELVADLDPSLDNSYK